MTDQQATDLVKFAAAPRYLVPAQLDPISTPVKS